ncbi:VOC family protein [Rhizobium sp. RCAM05973]|uniref:VOC family protein n=1 Tax=Rhizobium sp. RCAM05973 TaxID=2994066 RepID=UPI0022EBDD8C|nr:VOC family protein [Rhizobium sp. RCAM05973]
MTENGTIPFSLLGFDHIVFLIDDMPAALHFYGTILGCQPGYSYPAIGMEQLWCGNSLLVLWDVTHPGAAGASPRLAGGRNIDHLCIAIGPFDASRLKQHLAQHGIAIVHEGFHGGARGEGCAIYILDPFGNKIELKGPAVYDDGRTIRLKEQQ